VERDLYFPYVFRGCKGTTLSLLLIVRSVVFYWNVQQGFSEKYFHLRQNNRRSRSFILLLTYRNSKEEEVGRICIMHGVDMKHVQTTWQIWVLGRGIYCLKECFQKLSAIGLVWLGLKSIVGLYEWDKERFEFHQRQQIREESSEY
jgi:hypothetical protein